VDVGLQKSNRERRRVRGLHENTKTLAWLVSNMHKCRGYLFVSLLSHFVSLSTHVISLPLLSISAA
jgi:hypothetical protein